MNMKRIQIILAALVLSVSVSCTADFLDVDPTTEIPEKDYYDDYETLLKGPFNGRISSSANMVR